jgi:hypothetical protein
MQPVPLPEHPLDPPDEFSARDVHLVTVGLTGDTSAEVIARRLEKAAPVEGDDGEMIEMSVVHWFRFNLKVSNRHIKKFMQKAGIRDIKRAEEGAYQYLKGYGPLKMKGLIVGIDSEDLGDGTKSNTFVMADVELDSQTVLYTPNKKLVAP